jgi:hypothetical protein
MAESIADEVRAEFIRKHGEPRTAEEFAALGTEVLAAKRAEMDKLAAQGVAALAALNAEYGNAGPKTNDGNVRVVRDVDGTVHIYGGKNITGIRKNG